MGDLVNWRIRIITRNEIWVIKSPRCATAANILEQIYGLEKFQRVTTTMNVSVPVWELFKIKRDSINVYPPEEQVWTEGYPPVLCCGPKLLRKSYGYTHIGQILLVAAKTFQSNMNATTIEGNLACSILNKLGITENMKTGLVVLTEMVQMGVAAIENESKSGSLEAKSFKILNDDLQYLPRQVIMNNISFQRCDPEELARQLTLYEHLKFRHIYIEYDLENLSEFHKSTSLTILSDWSNKVSNWVVSEILCTPDWPSKGRVFESFVKLAKGAKKLKNYNLMTAIALGLDSYMLNLSSIYAILPKKIIQAKNELCEFCSPADNFKILRAAQNESLEQEDCPTIPFLATILKDLSLIELANPDVNIQKELKEPIFNKLSKVQGRSYLISPIYIFWDYFDNGLLCLNESAKEHMYTNLKRIEEEEEVEAKQPGDSNGAISKERESNGLHKSSSLEYTEVRRIQSSGSIDSTAAKWSKKEVPQDISQAIHSINKTNDVPVPNSPAKPRMKLPVSEMVSPRSRTRRCYSQTESELTSLSSPELRLQLSANNNLRKPPLAPKPVKKKREKEKSDKNDINEMYSAKQDLLGKISSLKKKEEQLKRKIFAVMSEEMTGGKPSAKTKEISDTLTYNMQCIMCLKNCVELIEEFEKKSKPK